MARLHILLALLFDLFRVILLLSAVLWFYARGFAAVSKKQVSDGLEAGGHFGIVRDDF